MQVQTRVDVFEEIFLVFLGLGTLVGVVVIAYTLYNAYKYRDAGDEPDDDAPTLGELPTGGGSGKKLFVSFALSAIIVISLIIWTYGMLLYVEEGPTNPGEDAIEIEVTGDGFAWFFEYENGVEEVTNMNVPAGEPVHITVTAGDVWHSFGVTDLRVKADAIPGEYDETWFIADEAGEQHAIECFELCGPSHTVMQGSVNVMEPDEFEAWLEEEGEDEEENEEETDNGNDDADNDNDDTETEDEETENAVNTAVLTGGDI